MINKSMLRLQSKTSVSHSVKACYVGPQSLIISYVSLQSLKLVSQLCKSAISDTDQSVKQLRHGMQVCNL